MFVLSYMLSCILILSYIISYTISYIISDIIYNILYNNLILILYNEVSHYTCNGIPQTSAKEIPRLDRKDDQQQILQYIQILPYYQVVYAQTRIR